MTDQGPQGERGPAGDKGYPGWEGKKGEHGAAGVRGPRGVQGNVVLPRKIVYTVALAVLVATIGAMLFMTLVVGARISDGRAKAVCKIQNDIRAYLRYDARYNARLPLERAKLADSFLTLRECDKNGYPALTPAQVGAYLQQHVAPAAHRAGLSPAEFSPEFKRRP